MIFVQNGTLSFQDRILFDGISFSIQSDQKVALIGRNGTGKSTLLKILANIEQFDDGSVDIARGKKIAYLPQEMTLESDKTVWNEACEIFKDFFNLEKELARLEIELERNNENADQLLEKYSSLQEKIGFFEKSHILQSIDTILHGLGFSDAQIKMPVAQLSEGWKMRLVLAKLLLQDADFYLFDEPTNHLDIQSKEWLYSFLKNGSFGYVLVSHDRYFLDHACDYVLSLEGGKAIWFRGNFSQYCTYQEKEHERLHAAYIQQQKDLAKKRRTIDRFKASASKAKMVQSMIKQLEKVELIEPEPVLPTISLRFPEPERSGKIVLSVKNVAQSFDNKKIFSQVSFEIERGEKVAIVAANGVGKTTLINTITGVLSPKSGEVSFGHNVAYALFEQDQTKVLSPNKTILEEVSDACANISESMIRTFLGTFLFKGDDVFKKIKVLSGGERNRVAMVKVLLQRANFLILDEPTNHLDVYAQEVLLQALGQYNGTLLFVCHDHDFLSRLATRIIELTPDGSYSYQGSYDSYIAQKKHAQNLDKEVVSQGKEVAAKDTKVVSSKELYALKKKAAVLERKIHKKEDTIKRLTEKLHGLLFGTPEYTTIIQDIEQDQEQLQALMAEWESILLSLE